jgi:peptidoglycan/LPS O-acetylase OafA/YrhL
MALMIGAYVYNRGLLFNPIFSPLIIEFLAGVLISYLVVERKVTAYPAASLVAGVLTFVIGAELNRQLWGWHPTTRAFCFVVGAGLIVYAMLAFELRSKWTFARPWQTVGDASYSIYMWHQPALFALYWLCGRVGILNWAPPATLIIPFFAVMLGWGLISNRWLERPIQRALLTLLSKVADRWLPVRRTPILDSR